MQMPMKSQQRKLPTRLPAALLALALLACFSGSSFASDSFSERRTQVGLKLFRTLVSADLNIASKSNGEGELPVVLVYANDQAQAAELQQQLQSDFNAVGNVPVRIDIGSLSTLLASDENKPAAIFISQPLKAPEREALVTYSVKREIILFSPFDGDVEQGVLAGLSVQSTVRPLINQHTLERGRYRIKSFYLKVAKHYE